MEPVAVVMKISKELSLACHLASVSTNMQSTMNEKLAQLTIEYMQDYFTSIHFSKLRTTSHSLCNITVTWQTGLLNLHMK
jgi:hypothetical protein